MAKSYAEKTRDDWQRGKAKEAAARIVENRAQSAKRSAQQKNAQSVKETVRKDTVNKLRDAFGQKAMDKSNLKRVKRTK